MPGTLDVAPGQQSGPSPAATTSDAGRAGIAFIVSEVFMATSIRGRIGRCGPTRARRCGPL